MANLTLQDTFLKTICEEKIPVSIYLISGIKLQGRIESYNDFSILLTNGVTQLVYKQAIATILPTNSEFIKSS